MSRFVITIFATALASTFAIASSPVSAVVPGVNGRIVFNTHLGKPIPGDCGRDSRATFTVNPDGSQMQRLAFGDGCEPFPHWSPNGTEIAVLAEPCPSGGLCSAVIVNPDTGVFRELPIPDPAFDFACAVWSPDGSRLACVASSETEPSRNGVYTVRSSDGGDSRLVVAIPDDNIAGDYSPDGKRLVFGHSDTDSGETALLVVKISGGGLRQITPTGMVLNVEDGGSWSPTGDRIVFEARSAPDQRFSIWTVGADGRGLRQLPIAGCGGAISDPTSVGCHYPSWSPDGTKIALDRLGDIYAVNADGTDLFPVTRTGLGNGFGDWGPHPLAT